MEDLRLSKDYPALFKKAKEAGSINDMELIFNSVMSELGVADPVREQAEREASKLIAEYMNAKSKPAGKKI